MLMQKENTVVQTHIISLSCPYHVSHGEWTSRSDVSDVSQKQTNHQQQIEEEKFVQEMKEKKTLKRIDGNVIKYSALICYPKKTAKSLRLLETEWNSSKR